MSRISVCLLVGLIVAISTLAGHAYAGDVDTGDHPPPPPEFLIPIAPPPLDLAAALAQQDGRAMVAIEYLACGDDLTFQGSADIPGEDFSPFLIAKMQWLLLKAADPAALRSAVCIHTTNLQFPPDPNRYPVDLFPPDKLDQFQAKFNESSARTGPDCTQTIAGIKDLKPFGGWASITYQISALCLKAQLERVVGQLEYKDAQVGTDGLPCLSKAIGSFLTPPIVPNNEFTFSVKGDLDVDVRDATRLYFLNERARDKGFPILSEEARIHVRDKLLILHGPPGDAANGVLNCGNSEHSDEPPSELLDDDSWLESAIDDLGDAAFWLSKRLALLLVLNAGAPAVLALLGEGAAIPPLAAALAIAPAVATVAAGTAKIPETENHRLMIETSRYLKNQIILKEVPKNSEALAAEQAELKRWLLDFMGGVMRHDFAEYNSRPYQRYSLVAILNLADFAEDNDVRQGARMVLEYTAAKFAVASREGIRVAPYRRRIEYMDKNPKMLEFGGEGTDYSIAMMLVFAGQTQRLPNMNSEPGKKGIGYGAPAMMIYAATSTFAPDPAIVELAINKKTPYVQ
ncbi:hypothetical protein C2U70_06575, partial [Bradyrhizobium guangdongense]|uniref:hypothetical protein n=1 Tax=Bradyrhizobium guangdongense TaxID=1325090 RepID=UPI001AED5124